MVTNGGNTEGLFHGAFMESGAVIPRGDISLGQHDYDDLVRETGCAGAEDSLECLRQATFFNVQGSYGHVTGAISYRVCRNFLDPLTAVVNYVSQGLDLSGARGRMERSLKPRCSTGIARQRCQHSVRHG
jgi:hypothetical protein